MDRYDTIVIGAGHNGLVCAAYLARAGQRVLVLEAGSVPGGLAAKREFHPGFHAAPAHTAGHFSATVIKDLQLEAHGLTRSAIPLTGLGDDGRHISIADNEVRGVGQADGEAFGRYSRLMRRCAAALAPFWTRSMPGLGARGLGDLATFAKLGLNLRRMGRDDMREFLRIASLPARDLVDEFFEDELLKATLCWDGLIGSKMAPRSPNSAVLAMLYRSAGVGVDIGRLVASLAAAATAAGAEIRYDTAVERILIGAGENGLNAEAVKLVNGSSVAADRIVSGADPQTTFLALVGAEYLDIGFTNRIRRLRCDGLVAKLHLALDGLPEFTGLDRPEGRILIAPRMDAIEFAFDDAKYGECSAEPVLEIALPSLGDGDCAPGGQHVLSAHIMYAPLRLKGGWNDAARDTFRERVIDTIAHYAPGIRGQVLHAELLAPPDLEREYGVTGGHWHHTEFAMDQLLMMRPTYGAAQYRTPIPGLFLCSAGSHPGGDLTGAPGHNAAREILR